MIPEQRFFVSSTMRAGASLLVNLISVHSRMILLYDRVHFFRFYYKKYDPLNKRNTERLLHHLRIRFHYRMGIKVEVDPILERIENRGFEYSVIWDEIMTYFLRRVNKQIWGEHSGIGWRNVPAFFSFYPEGRVIHLYRDPRGVLSSFKKMTFLPDNGYLNSIFIWIDSINYMDRYCDIYSQETFLPLKYEDIMSMPENMSRKLCDFIGVPFEEIMIQPEKWKNVIGNELVPIPSSSHEGKNVIGFSTTRSVNWKKHLEDWEVCLVEMLAGDKLERLGYEPYKEKYSSSTIRKGFDVIKKSPALLKNLYIYMANGEGIPGLPNDSTDPRNWGVSGSSEKFINTPMAKDYFREMEQIERMIEEKYAGL
jgi:hypothetical protein